MFIDLIITCPGIQNHLETSSGWYQIPGWPNGTDCYQYHQSKGNLSKEKAKTLSDLRTEIQTLIAFNKMRPVIVRADKTVIFDRVVQVLDVARNVGVERFGIAIEEKPPKWTPLLREKKSLNKLSFPNSSVFTRIINREIYSLNFIEMI